MRKVIWNYNRDNTKVVTNLPKFNTLHIPIFTRVLASPTIQLPWLQPIFVPTMMFWCLPFFPPPYLLPQILSLLRFPLPFFEYTPTISIALVGLWSSRIKCPNVSLNILLLILSFLGLPSICLEDLVSVLIILLLCLTIVVLVSWPLWLLLLSLPWAFCTFRTGQR